MCVKRVADLFIVIWYRVLCHAAEARNTGNSHFNIKLFNKYCYTYIKERRQYHLVSSTHCISINEDAPTPNKNNWNDFSLKLQKQIYEYLNLNV